MLGFSSNAKGLCYFNGCELCLCCLGVVTACQQYAAYHVVLIRAAIWAFSCEQLFSVCNTLDHDYVAIYHPWINSTVITPLQSCLFKGLTVLQFVSKMAIWSQPLMLNWCPMSPKLWVLTSNVMDQRHNFFNAQLIWNTVWGIIFTLQP